MKIAAFVAGALLLSGCASGPKFQDTSFAEPELEQSRIFFYRPSSFSYAIKPEISIDGVVVGKSEAKGFFFVDVDEGTYTINTHNKDKYSVSVSTFNEKVVYIKVKMRVGFLAGHGELIKVPAEVGRKEITKTKHQKN